jgi:hypothetical protein
MEQGGHGKSWKCISVRTFHIYCLAGVKFGKGDAHIMLLSTLEFTENGCKKGSTLITGGI